MILIAGGTGRLGALLVERLTGRGLDVRVLTRDPARAEHLDTSLISVMIGDVRDRGSLSHAFVGVDLVISAIHGFDGPGAVSPANVDRDGNANLIDAARAVGADVVLMSIAGASPTDSLELGRMKAAAEDHLKASGTSWTILRPTAYLELWIDLLQQTAARSGRPLVFGRGNSPINFVSVRDVAALVDRVVDDQSARNATFDLGGPNDLTFNELAAAVQVAAGRTSKPRHVPRPALRLMALGGRLFKPQLARQASAALVLDQAPRTLLADSARRRYPDLPSTELADVPIVPGKSSGRLGGPGRVR